MSSLISSIRTRCTPILPAVYSESLSYYEEVCKVVAKMNEIIEIVNNIDDSILEVANHYTDNAVRDMESRVYDAVQEVNSLKEEITKEFDVIVDITEEKLNIIDDRLDEMYSRMEALVVELDERMNISIQENNNFIFSKLEKSLSQIKVVNYFTGMRVTVQEMFNYLAMLHTESSIRYDELTGKNVTFDYLAGLNISYTNLVLHGNGLIN